MREREHALGHAEGAAAHRLGPGQEHSRAAAATACLAANAGAATTRGKLAATRSGSADGRVAPATAAAARRQAAIYPQTPPPPPCPRPWQPARRGPARCLCTPADESASIDDRVSAFVRRRGRGRHQGGRGGRGGRRAGKVAGQNKGTGKGESKGAGKRGAHRRPGVCRRRGRPRCGDGDGRGRSRGGVAADGCGQRLASRASAADVATGQQRLPPVTPFACLPVCLQVSLAGGWQRRRVVVVCVCARVCLYVGRGRRGSSACQRCQTSPKCPVCVSLCASAACAWERCRVHLLRGACAHWDEHGVCVGGHDLRSLHPV